eukprot:5148222-Amphidinium_carterae.1
MEPLILQVDSGLKTPTGRHRFIKQFLAHWQFAPCRGENERRQARVHAQICEQAMWENSRCLVSCRPHAARRKATPGQRVELELELRTITDCSLLGAPNSGKVHTHHCCRHHHHLALVVSSGSWPSMQMLPLPVPHLERREAHAQAQIQEQDNWQTTHLPACSTVKKTPGRTSCLQLVGMSSLSGRHVATDVMQAELLCA